MSSSDKLRSEPPDDLPYEIDQWPYEARIEWAKKMYTREGLIMQLLTRSNFELDEPLGKDYFLTKEELAAIYLGFRGVSDEA